MQQVNLPVSQGAHAPAHDTALALHVDAKGRSTCIPPKRSGAWSRAGIEPIRRAVMQDGKPLPHNAALAEAAMAAARAPQDHADGLAGLSFSHPFENPSEP